MVLHEDSGAGFRLLEDYECLWLLEQKTIGRIAVSVGALPAVFPVNYEMLDGDIFFLTGQGTKLAAAVHRTPVAFQIDEFDVLYRQGWSVLAVGRAEVVDIAEVDHILQELTLQPWAPGPRNDLVRVRPEFLSGRRIGFIGEP